jgi:hypothetical protein
MPVFKTLSNILISSWEPTIESKFCLSKTVSILPEKKLSRGIKSVEDIELWEQIYHQIGNFGIYAAWSPYAEIYIIVYYMFSKLPGGIQVYYSSEDVYQKARALGVTLPFEEILEQD